MSAHSMSNHEQDTNVGFGWRINRTALELLLYPLTPQEITPGTRDHLEQLRAYLKQGYAALIPYNHPSLRDGPDIVLFLLRQRELQKKHIISAIGIHQYRKWMEPVAKFSNVDLYPIMTPHARTMEEFRDCSDMYGLKSYFTAVDKGLRTGALIPITIGGQRGDGFTNVVSTHLDLSLRHKCSEKVVVVPFGLSIVDTEESLGDLDSLHVGKIFRYGIGEPVPVPTLLQRYSLHEVDGAQYRIIQSLVRGPMVQ